MKYLDDLTEEKTVDECDARARSSEEASVEK
jgi:hypothetical protein